VVRGASDRTPETGPEPGRRDVSRAEALAELSGSLAQVGLEPHAVMDQVARLVSGFLGDTVAVRLIGDGGDNLESVAIHDPHSAAAPTLQRVIGLFPRESSATDPYDDTTNPAETVALHGAELQLMKGTFSRAARTAFDALNVTAVLIAPMRARGRVIGTLGLWRRGDRAPHGERDRQFVQELADRAGLAIDGAQLVERLKQELDERRRAEESLKLTLELQQRLDGKRRALVESMVTAQEAERKRIAADVHDDSIQAMAAVGIRLQVLRRKIDDPALLEGLSAIEDTVAETVSRLRSLLFQLDPAGLESVSLSRAVQTYIDHTFRDSGVSGRVQGLLSHEPPPETRVILYRIIQEALTNVRKHAGASLVTVTLAEDEVGYTVSIRDDGRGFDIADTGALNLPGHLGLRGMRDRAQAAGGLVQAESTVGTGTVVRIWIPANNPELRLLQHAHSA